MSLPRALATATTLLLALAAADCSSHKTVVAQSQDNESNSYVNPRTCALCHATEAEHFRHTGMARAFYKPTAESFPDPKPYFHRPSRTWYQIVSKDGAYYQRVWQVGYTGKEESVQEWKIDYVMGSGNHVRSYLHKSIRNTLNELPLAWYSEKGGFWALNPGFDNKDSSVARKIGYECMFCHNAYPSIPAGHDDAGAEAVFTMPLPEGIDCQRCHGPGGNHVRAAQTPKVKPEDLRKSIVNPARLSAERKMEVCMQCHLESTSIPLPNLIRRYDRAPYSYRPGEPLSAFEFFYDHAPGRGKDDKFEIVNSVYRLRKSQCFLQSKGALSCLTCHDPHDIPHGPSADDHYNAACRQCHAVIQAANHPQAGSCIGCHMPKRRTEDVEHVVMTDHLIQRRPGKNLLAEFSEEDQDRSYFGEVVPYGVPDLGADDLYTAVAQTSGKTNLAAGLPRLEAALAQHKPARAEFYLQMGDAYTSTNQYDKAVTLFQEAVKRKPNSVALRRLAYAYLGSDHLPQALETLQRATQVDPSDAAVWYDMGLVQLDLGKKMDAVASLRKSIELDPESADAEDRLGAALNDIGERDLAEAAFRAALRIQPTLALAHANLASLLAARNELAEAAWHYDRAGDKAIDQFRYGVTLARMNRMVEAQAHLQAALTADPNLAEAHEVLGGLLEKGGHLDTAQVQYREAIRIRPDFGNAHFDLGRVLAKQRDTAGAAEEFRKAAADPDPELRERSQRALRAIGAL